MFACLFAAFWIFLDILESIWDAAGPRIFFGLRLRWMQLRLKFPLIKKIKLKNTRFFNTFSLLTDF